MSIKKIAIIMLAILLIAVAVSGVVVFFNDSGISDASSDNSINVVDENIVSSENNIVTNEIINNIEANSSINTNNVSTNNNVNKNNISNNFNTNNSNNNSEQDKPQATTIEKEKVVSEKLKLSWIGMPLLGIDTDFSNTGIYYTDFEVEKQAKIIPTSELAEIDEITGEPIAANIGDVIEYTLKVKNTGTLPLEDLLVVDEMLGVEKTVTIPVGYEYEEVFKYTVAEEDVVNSIEFDGIIYNTLIGKYQGEEKQDTTETPVEIEYTYTVEYYYNNEIDNNLTEIYSKKINTVVLDYDDKKKPGYKFEKVENLPLTITNDISKNVIKVYYVLENDIKYVVEHYKQKIDGTYSTQPNDIDRLTGTAFTEATYCPKSYDGFKYMANLTTPTDKTIKADEMLVIKLYYNRLQNLTYKVNYLEKDNPNNVLHAPKTVENQTFGEIITSENEVIEIEGYNYDSVDKDRLTIGIEEDIINIYYTPRTDLAYTVNYLEKDNPENVLHAPKTVENQTFGTVITSINEVIDIEGYDYNSVDKETLTIGVKENIINIYYTPRTDLSYTVNYLEKDNLENVLHAPKTVENQTFGAVITSANEIIEIEGYNYNSVDKDTLTIGIKENIINIYYTPRTDLSYTVKYFYNGIEDTTPGVSYTVDNQTFGSKVTSYIPKADLNGGNWTLDTDNTTALPYVITLGANIINVHYIKADIVVEKEAPARANAGSEIEYKIKLTNNGLLTGTVDVIDNLPAGIIVNTTTLADSIYSDKDRTITWPDVSVANGSTVILTFKAKIAENKIGDKLINIVSLSNGATASAITNVNELKSSVDEVIQGDKHKDDVNIVLVIDISSTMSKDDIDNIGTTRLEAAKNASKAFVNTLYASDLNKDATISLVTFDADANINLAGKEYKDKSTIIDTINTLTNGYGTDIYKGLVGAENVISSLKANYHNNQNVIIFLGDGYPYGGDSNNTPSGIINKASQLKSGRDGAIMYTIGFGSEAAKESTDEQSAYYILKNMASEGKFSTALTGVELAAVFTNVADEIINRPDTTSTKGIMTIPTSKNIVVNSEYPIIVKYKDIELFRCTSIDDLNNYYMSYINNQIVWNINRWNSVARNTKIITNQIEFIYYIPRD